MSDYKLIMTWDILPGKEQAYFEFVVRKFLPDVQKMGLTPSEAWVTIYGDYPQVLVGAIVPSLSKAIMVVNSSAWEDLIDQLMSFITNYSYKIVPASTGFQF